MMKLMMKPWGITARQYFCGAQRFPFSLIEFFGVCSRVDTGKMARPQVHSVLARRGTRVGLTRGPRTLPGSSQRLGDSSRRRRLASRPSSGGPGAGPETTTTSESQLVHDEVGRLVDAAVRESGYGALSPRERRARVALDLASEVDLRTHRLLPDVNEFFVLLANVVEVMWRSGFDFDLAAAGRTPDFYAYPTIHPHAESDPALVEPAKRMRLENKEYQTSRFRRLHLELAAREDGLQVSRAVMFPRVRYDIPIFALDMVSVNGRVTFVIVDCSPVTRDGVLPEVYTQAMAQLRRKHFAEADMAPLPEWADQILSPLCVCLRPRSDEDVSAFIGYCAELLNFHIECSSCFSASREESAMTETYRAHERYAKHQWGNQKTRSVLEASFGATFADSYMRQTLFDVEPGLGSRPSVTDFEDEVVLNGAVHPVSTGPLARVDSELRGGSIWVPKGNWTPGEEVAMLRLLNTHNHAP